MDTDADELVLTPSLPITEPSVHHATSALPPTPTRTVPVSPPSDVVQQTDTVESHKVRVQTKRKFLNTVCVQFLAAINNFTMVVRL